MFDGDLLAERARVTPEKLALVVLETGERLTYAQLNARAEDAAAQLRDRGFREGDRVTIPGTNSLEFIATFFGSLKLGTIAVPLSTRATEHEIKQIIEDCERSPATRSRGRNRVRHAESRLPIQYLSPACISVGITVAPGLSAE